MVIASTLRLIILTGTISSNVAIFSFLCVLSLSNGKKVIICDRIIYDRIHTDPNTSEELSNNTAIKVITATTKQ